MATTQIPANLRRLTYVRQGYSVDNTTGYVYSVGNRIVGYVTEAWMRKHGWLA